MLRHLHSTIVIVFTFLLIGCGRDFEEFTPHQGQMYINQVFSEVNSPNENLAFLASNSEIKLVSNSGVLFIIQCDELIEQGVITQGEELTLSLWNVSSSMDLLRQQLSTSINNSIFEAQSTIKYDMRNEASVSLTIDQPIVRLIIPSVFDDGGEVTIYKSTNSDWTDIDNQENLSSGNYEIPVDEATIWSDFGYSLYGSSNTWYTISKDNSNIDAQDMSVCVDGDLDVGNSQLYLVTEDNVCLRIAYNALTENFCDSWFTKFSERSFSLYAIKAESEANFYLSITDSIDNQGPIEVDISNSLEEIEKEALVTRLKE